MVWDRVDTPSPFPWSELNIDIDGSDIDVRLEIEKCITNHGHEIFIRKPTSQRCSCWQEDSAFDEFYTGCSDCQGFGYAYEDIRTRAYRRPAFGTFGFVGATVRSDVGMLGVGDTVWYFRHNVPAVVGYHLVECTTDDIGVITAPIQIERLHEVKLAHLYRDRRGRPEYFAVLARDGTIGK
jgi:hypothetical protein